MWGGAGSVGGEQRREQKRTEKKFFCVRAISSDPIEGKWVEGEKERIVSVIIV
ncbi:hypothetical protein [Moorena producens]|uniref:hypothetical protein n=1 Tax=Moorena producens TaxID=1155739 RepID=UPI001E4A1A95|nr:hypothetical protein [Moorena producens]